MLEQSPPKQVVVVVGMHRSGTSAISKSLELLGVNLGVDLIPPQPDNPTGFWEDASVFSINVRLLRTYGADFDTLSIPQPIDPSAEQVRALFEEAVALIQARTSGEAIWGFKDPRTSRLLPFWIKAIQAAGTEPLFVIACRNPLEVAASLEKRNQIPRIVSLCLWAQHTLQPLVETQGFPRVVVEYEELLRAPYEQVVRIGRVLRLPIPAQNSEKVRAYAAEFLASEMRHACYRPSDLENDAEVPHGIIDLYRRVREEAVGGPLFARDLEPSSRWLAEATPWFPLVDALLEAQRMADSRERAMMTQQAELLARCGTAEQEITSLMSQVEELARRNAQKQATIDSILTSRSWRWIDCIRRCVGAPRGKR